MTNIFLQASTLNPEYIMDGGILGGLFALLVAFFILFLIIAIALYVYTSYAFMVLARKTKTEPAGIAWIPFIGPPLVASRIAEMHWWPLLLLIGFWIPFVNVVLMIVFAVFFVIWMWKTFESVGKPGWWAIFMVIPFLNIIYLIFLGIAAWSK